jgi:hypothetical protein
MLPVVAVVREDCGGKVGNVGERRGGVYVAS